jgi:hypothetical protein
MDVSGPPADTGTVLASAAMNAPTGMIQNIGWADDRTFILYLPFCLFNRAIAISIPTGKKRRSQNEPKEYVYTLASGWDHNAATRSSIGLYELPNPQTGGIGVSCKGLARRVGRQLSPSWLCWSLPRLFVPSPVDLWLLTRVLFVARAAAGASDTGIPRSLYPGGLSMRASGAICSARRLWRGWALKSLSFTLYPVVIRNNY